MDSWYLTRLVCPRDYHRLEQKADFLICPEGHSYPVVDGIPVMLLDDDDIQQTMGVIDESIKRAKGDENVIDKRAPHLYLETLGISEEEKNGVIELSRKSSNVDPVVAYMVSAACGHMYKSLRGRINSYPIPNLRLPRSNGATLLDLGCNWGRWSIATLARVYKSSNKSMLGMGM